ncbi:MAG: YkgJ family cysteine cluster protein [Fibrobacteres bacterium]|jgi:Fe-S-cluster containining protein|nr:YkgJ family cysteine cluster protein [Fibrobacterota bacterium]
MRNDHDPPLPTLAFTDWLRAMDASARSGEGMAVDCGECRGCCTSSYFIPIESDEKETLAHIPKRLLFPAPGKSKGRWLIGFDEKGHCAFFKDNACSIYAHRPRVCRAYDCRVFPATGLSEDDKPAIANQAKRWRFGFPSAEDERQFEAARAAARFLRGHAADFPEAFLPSQATQLAALALRIRSVFLGKRSTSAAKIAEILALAAHGAGSG